MRKMIILLIGLLIVSSLQAQSPYPSFPPPPTGNSASPPLNLTVTPASAPALQQMSTASNSVKPGDKVMVTRGTYIRSGPGEQTYACGVIEAGSMVTILDYPSVGSDFTPIAAPDNCYSLIPVSAVHHSWAMWVDLKKMANQPQKVLTPTETLIYGESPTGEYLHSGYKLPKGSLVILLDQKKVRIQNKEVLHFVIRAGGKEKRFIRTDCLQGVAAAAQTERPTAPPSSSYQSPSFSNQGSNSVPWPGPASSTPSSVQQAGLEAEVLPAYLQSQVQAADQAYQTAIRYGAWEDARARYQQLLESEVLSVRIVAKNRLEFISDWQKNPPVVTTAMTPQQGAGLTPTMNSEPWLPGDIAATRPRVMSTPANAPIRSVPVASAPPPAPVKDMTIKPNQPAVPTSNQPAVTVPVYPGPGGAMPQQSPPPRSSATTTPAAAPGSVPANTPAGVPTSIAPATTPGRMKMVGKLNRAVQYSGPNQLYYLTNSQGFMTYYVRAVSNSGFRLNEYLGRNVEVEGQAIQASIDGQTKPQLNVDRVRLLQ